MAVVLLGAFSRYINNLQDEDLEKELTHITLRALRRCCSTPLLRVYSLSLIIQGQISTQRFVTAWQISRETS